MRLAYDQAVAYFKDGFISGLSLGSDACAEHECGINAMRSQHCGAFIPRETRIRQYKETGVRVPYSLEESQKITNNLELFQRVGILGQHNGIDVIHNSRWDIAPLKNLCRPYGQFEFDKNKAPFRAAWSERAFCVWSDNEKFQKKLLKFWDALVGGKAMFFTTKAPMWKDTYTSGLVIVDTTRLAYHDRKVIEDQQKEDDFKVELGFKGEADAIMDLHNEKFGNRWFGYLREDRYNEKGEVVYFLNPDYNTNADFYGPYTKGQLVRWINEGKSYRLTQGSPE